MKTARSSALVRICPSVLARSDPVAYIQYTLARFHVVPHCGSRGPGLPSVRRRPLDVVNYQHFDEVFGRHYLQP